MESLIQKQGSRFRFGRWSSRATVLIGFLTACTLNAQTLQVQNAAGVRMAVDEENTDPTLEITVPDGPADQRSFKILLPEHITVRAHGETEAKHLYIFRPGTQDAAPEWKQAGKTLEYAKDFGDIHVVAHATLAEDGILFRYEFINRSTTDYDMATAVTDPRFRRVFYDPRLERTYVHRKEGFGLLAADTPDRLTMPLTKWFPVRYLASFTAPIPTDRVQRRDDGITYRYGSQRVDIPMIATLSSDRTWVAASFAREPGNVWSNPELTCQHVDPEVPLPHGAHAEYEIKILMFKGSLNDALRKVAEQRGSLR